MGIKFSNNAKTSLSAALSSSATSCTVSDASVFPTIGSYDYFYLTFEETGNNPNNEVVKVTAVSGNTLTITRAQDGTTARAFSSGDKAELRLTTKGLEDVVDNSEVVTTAPSASDGNDKPAGYVWYVVS